MEAASEDATDVVMHARAIAAAVRRHAVQGVQIARCMRRKEEIWRVRQHVQVYVVEVVLHHVQQDVQAPANLALVIVHQGVLVVLRLARIVV